MKKRKNGKQFKLNNFKNYKVTYGTVDKTNPQTMYITFTSWVEPKQENVDDYNKVLRGIKRQIKDWLYQNLDRELFDNLIPIVDLDLRVSGIKFNKKSYMSCEITIFKKTEDDILSDVITSKVNNIVNGIASKVIDNNEYFTFNKTKNTIKTT
jgi:hypothetical protein